MERGAESGKQGFPIFARFVKGFREKDLCEGLWRA